MAGALGIRKRPAGGCDTYGLPVLSLRAIAELNIVELAGRQNYIVTLTGTGNWRRSWLRRRNFPSA
jgi:hypothetical protein